MKGFVRIEAGDSFAPCLIRVDAVRYVRNVRGVAQIWTSFGEYINTNMSVDDVQKAMVEAAKMEGV